MFSDYALNKAEYLAFTERVSCHTVGLLMHANRGVGTGTLITYGDQRVVLTADHNLTQTSAEDIRFYMRPAGTMQERSVKHDLSIRPRVLSIGDTLSFRCDPIRDRKNDIAALVLEPSQQLSGAASFYDATRLVDYPIADGTSIIVLGFPLANSTELAPGVNILGATSDHGIYDSARNYLAGLPSSYDPEEQFLLNYTRIEDDLAPEGFSGAAVWVNWNVHGPIWKPNPGFAGVVTGYLAKRKLLVVAQVGPVLRLLARI
jgi:hypothetical protein